MNLPSMSNLSKLQEQVDQLDFANEIKQALEEKAKNKKTAAVYEETKAEKMDREVDLYNYQQNNYGGYDME